MNKINSEEVAKKAKKIMDDFIKELDKIPEMKEYGSIRETNTRIIKSSNSEKNKPKKDNTEFRELILNNAPKIKDNCIVAEKKTW